jgi:hypothetical protein
MNPLFDNIQFKEDVGNSEDIFVTDRERQQSSYTIERTAQEIGEHLIYGNRNFLMMLS